MLPKQVRVRALGIVKSGSNQFNSILKLSNKYNNAIGKIPEQLSPWSVENWKFSHVSFWPAINIGFKILVLGLIWFFSCFHVRGTPSEAAGFPKGLENMGLCPHRRALQNLVIVVVEGEAWVSAWWEHWGELPRRDS